MAVKTKEKEKAKKTQKPGKEQVNIFKGMMNELKKVTWPTKKETVVYTTVVVVTVIVFTLIIGAYDLLLSKLIEFLLSF